PGDRVHSIGKRRATVLWPTRQRRGHPPPRPTPRRCRQPSARSAERNTMPDHETTLARTIATARSQTVGDLLRRSAQRFPERLAIADAERRLTYREFDAVVNRVANALIARGIGKGDAVALLSRNSSQYAVLTLALARVGALLVPINFM